MQISKTDAQIICRYISDAVKLYRQHTTSTRDLNRIRLLNNLQAKLKKKLLKQS